MFILSSGLSSIAEYMFIINFALAALNAVLLCLVAYRSIQTLQLRGYKTERYMHWVKNTHGRYFSRLFMLCFMSGCAVLIVNILFSSFSSSITVLSLIFYFAYLIVFIKNDFKQKKKTPLKFTNRIKRLMVMLFALCFLASYGLALLSLLLETSPIGFLKFVYLCFTPLITPFLVLIAFWIMLPAENYHNHSYVKRAGIKIDKHPGLIRIGITGSYGKTGVKNILHAMLSQKYNVLTTPSSYNTPMGLTKVILKDLDAGHDVFIAEMGARSRGDIKYICDFIKPQYAIITSIANQHIETFKTIENVMAAKFELIEALPQDGYAVFGGDNCHIEMLHNKCAQQKNKVCKDILGGHIYCGNITVGNKLTFDLTIGADTRRVSCNLYGAHNINNILLSAAMADRLGVGIDMIAASIRQLQPVAHRLEVHRLNGINIIDDSFNANPHGAAAALEVLKSFDGNKKIIITPGLVELGELWQQENFAMGERIAASADIAILIGERQTMPIREGLESKGFDSNNIYTFNCLDDAKMFLPKVLSDGDVVLFENDLPDNYSEH